MDSGYKQEQYDHHYQQKQQINTNGLTRFRSAPSSYFATFLNSSDPINSTAAPPDSGGRGGRDDFSSVRPLSPETENIFASFMSNMSSGESNSSSSTQKLCNIPENSAVQQEYLPQVKQETETLQHMVYQSQSKPPLVNQKGSSMDVQFRSSNSSTSMEIKSMNNNNNYSLTRHSSSPAGFFNSLLDFDNDYDMIKGIGSYGVRSDQTNFSQGQPSSTSELMTQNTEFTGKRFSNSNHSSDNDRKYMTGYSMNSWDDSILSETFSSLDRAGGDDGSQTFSELKAIENRIGEGRNRLAHHLSLPSSSTMERLLQFQDTTPLRSRAKRGCATHPRSIAERVRRTKISDRMRKLQDLVPSMDKQTNTADMLDLAVEYIKDLQNTVKNLHDKRTKCTCPR